MTDRRIYTDILGLGKAVGEICGLAATCVIWAGITSPLWLLAWSCASCN